MISFSWQVARRLQAMTKKYELKMEVLGPNAGREVRVLNRITRWTRTGLEYESDQRPAERTLSELEREACKSVSIVRRPSEHEAHKWWCDHVEWTWH